ncbi:MAG: hypothetical protein EBV03_03305 [Proteobacteria bacterium]|nr:hypothetical protein [Pseudomonadota bacterium]
MLERGKKFYDFMTRYFIDNGYEIKATNYIVAGTQDELTFQPRRDQQVPDGRTFRVADDPRAAAQEIIERLQELQGITKAHSERTGNPLPFERALEELNLRHETPPKEVVPPVADIRKRTTHNVPQKELHHAISLGVCTSNVEDHLPGGMPDLEKLTAKTLQNLRKQPLFSGNTSILGTRAETSDHQVRKAVRTALKNALTELHATEPQKAEDAVMAAFVQEMHKAKRRNPPFRGMA